MKVLSTTHLAQMQSRLRALRLPHTLRHVRHMSALPDALLAIRQGDQAAALKALPKYLDEYRKAIPTAKGMESPEAARFENLLRRMQPATLKDNSKYLAAAVIDLARTSPKTCQAAVLFNTLMFASLAEVMDPQEMLDHMRLTKVGGESFSDPAATLDALASQSLDSLPPETRNVVVSLDFMFRSWYHGLFFGGRGVYDSFLEQTLQLISKQQQARADALAPSDAQGREAIMATVAASTAMIMPGDAPDLRPPLAELPLPGIDMTIEEFADACLAPRFYPFLSLSPDIMEMVHVSVPPRVRALP
jgi:hypothetical protein